MVYGRILTVSDSNGCPIPYSIRIVVPRNLNGITAVDGIIYGCNLRPYSRHGVQDQDDLSRRSGTTDYFRHRHAVVPGNGAGIIMAISKTMAQKTEHKGYLSPNIDTKVEVEH